MAGMLLTIMAAGLAALTPGTQQARTRQARNRRVMATLQGHAGNAPQLDLVNQVGIRRNEDRVSCFAETQPGRNEDLALAAGLHAGDAFLQARNQLADAEDEELRPLAFAAGVKLRVIGL